jgi:hypothetical protein
VKAADFAAIFWMLLGLALIVLAVWALLGWWTVALGLGIFFVIAGLEA